MRYSARSGFTLVEWLVGVIALLMLGALLVPAFVRASRQEKVLACRSNLRGLYQARKTSPALGKEYWARVSDPQLLRCPLVEGSGALGGDYWGPASDPAGLGEKEPLSCDAVENHGPEGRQGGNVLLKSGEVITDNFQLWGLASRGGKCRP